MLSSKNYYRLQAWGLIARLNLDMFLMSRKTKAVLGLVLALVLAWSGFTLLYAASNSCLRDQRSLTCWVINGDFAEWTHTTWLFNR